MGTEMDRLEIAVESQASKANQQLDLMIRRLSRVASALTGIETKGLSHLSDGVRGFSSAVKTMDATRIADISKMARQLGRLTKVDLSSLNNVAKPVKDFSSALQSLTGLSGISVPKLDTKNVNSVVSTLEKLSGINVDAGKLASITSSFKTLSGLANIAIPEIDAKNLNSVASVIGKLSKINPGSLPQVADGLEKVSKSLAFLGAVNLKDSGVNNVVNALNRLFKADFGKFKPGAFDDITKSISSLAGIPDVSNALNRFISSLSKLANAGDKAKTVAAELPILGNALYKTVNKLVKAKDISESINLFVQSIGRLAGAGSKTAQTAGQLSVLADETLKFFHAMEKAPQISENTVRMTEALAKLASAGGKIGTATISVSDSFEKLSQLSKKASGIITGAFHRITQTGKKTVNVIKSAFQNITQILEKSANMIKNAFGKITQGMQKAASGIKKAASGITSAFSKVSSAGSGLNTASFSLGTLLKTVAGFKSAKALWNFGKSAIDFGSDITEVENVVDTAFGSMANMAYEFASTATEKFGLSELAAKQYSGTMMAMLKSSGVAQESAAKMSTSLAGLAGDIASFYNIDTDEAFYKLRAAIAGETEPMKALGVNMNIVNLEAYAMSQGITKAYKDMTLAEQSILRYNYILAKTGDAQGDFARTAGTWANQMRLLRLNIQSISAVIGQGLIAAILPAIQLLNKFMSKLMQAAKVFRDFMYVLTGKKMKGASKGVVNDLAGIADYTTDISDVGDSGEDAADGLEDAADSAKKLKKALSVLPFDELNQLASSAEDLASSMLDKAGVGIGADDFGLGDMSGMFDNLGEKDMITPINEWARRIREAFLAHDWEGLGRTIAEMMNAGLKKVYSVINDITPKVERALKTFAKVFNAWLKYFDWDLLGRTVGAGINLLTKAFNALTGPGGIDFDLLGQKLSVGFRGLVDEIDWRGLGNALGNGFMISWRIFSGFVHDMWRTEAKTGLTGWQEFGRALADGVNGIFERIDFGKIGTSIALSLNGIAQTLEDFTNRVDWVRIADNISNGFTNLINILRGADIGHTFGLFISDVIGTMESVARSAPWGTLGQNIAQFLVNIPWSTIFGQVLNIITEVFGGTMLGFIQEILPYMNGMGTELGNAFNNMFIRLSEFTRAIPWDDIAEGISELLNASISKIRPISAAKSLGNFVTSLLDTMLRVAQKTRWHELGIKIGQFLSTIPWPTIIGQVFDTITTVFGNLLTGLVDYIVRRMPEVGTALADGFNYAFQKLKAFVESVNWKDIGHSIATGLNNMIHGINWADAGKTLSNFVRRLLDVFFTVAKETDWKAFGEGIGDLLSKIDWLGILWRVAGTIGTILGEVITGLGKTAAGKTTLVVEGVWLAIKGVGLANKVLGIVNDVAKNFNLLPEGVNSVIPLLAKSIGKITAEGGLFSGIASGAAAIVSKVGGILGSIGSVIFSPQGALILGIIAGVGLIIANWDKIKEAAGKVKDWVVEKWEGLKQKTNEIWGDTTEKLGTTWGGLNTTAGTVFNKIAGNVTSAWSSTESDTSTSWENAEASLKTCLSNMNASANAMMASIKATVSASMAEISSIYTSQWQAIAGISNVVMQQTQSAIAVVMQSIKTLISTSMQEVAQIFSSSWASIGGISSMATAQMNADVLIKMASMKITVITSMQEMSVVFSNAWRLIGSMSAAATAQMQADVTSKMNSILNIVNASMTSIRNVYSSGWNQAVNVTSNTLAKMQNVVSSKMNAIKNSINTAMNGIQNTFQSKWNAINNASSQTLVKMQSNVTSKMNAMKNTVNSSMNGIQNTFTSKWNAIKNAVMQALSKMQTDISSKMNAMKSTVNNSMNSIVSAFKSQLSRMKSAVSSEMTNILNIFRNLPNQIVSSMSGLYSAGQRAALSFANGFRSVHIPTPHIFVSSWTEHRAGDSRYSTPNFGINWYANGGLFTRPTIAGFGEAGDEAALPLDNQRVMRKISKSILSNAPQGGMENIADDIKQAVMEGIAEVMMNNSSQTGTPQYIQNSIYLDGDVMARVVTKAQEDKKYRYNPA